MENLEYSLVSLCDIAISIHHFNKKFEKNLGLSLVQWCLLKRLVDMPTVSAHSLAKAVRVHPSTLTQTLKRLEKRKFIFIAEDPKDSRKKLISMTRLGKGALDHVNTSMEKWSINLSHLTQEFSLIRNLLEQLHF